MTIQKRQFPKPAQSFEVNKGGKLGGVVQHADKVEITLASETDPATRQRLMALAGNLEKEHRPYLPPPPPHLFGRAQQLQAIADALRPEVRLWGVLIYGEGGIGKTALAIRAIHDAPARHFSTKVFLSAKAAELTADGLLPQQDYAAPDFQTLLLHLAHELGDSTATATEEEQRPRAVCRALMGRNALIVFDNVETLKDKEIDRLYAFLRKLPDSCKAIVTSRRMKHVGAEEITLGKLEQEDAFRLLKALSKANRHLGALRREDRQILYENTNGNPLLLTWVVAQFGRQGSRCRTVQEACEFLAHPPNANDPLEYLFGEFVATFTPSQKKALASLAHFRQQANVAWIARGTDISSTAVRTALDDLSDRPILEFDEKSGLFLLPPLVVSFLCRKCADSVAKAGRALGDHALSLALENGFGDFKRFKNLESEWGVIQSALPILLKREPKSIRKLREALTPFLETTGRTDELRLLLKATGGSDGKGDEHNAARHVFIGRTPGNRGEAEASYLRMLFHGLHAVRLQGLDTRATDPGAQRLELRQVYVALDTTSVVPNDGDPRRKEKHSAFRHTSERELPRACGLIDAVTQHRRVVILGDPGSGKSTFLDHLSLCLAANGVEPQAAWLQRLPGWPEAEAMLLPIVVHLRQFAGELATVRSSTESNNVFNFIVRSLSRQNMEFAASPLQEALERGSAIVFCDGLDEVPHDKLDTVRESLLGFVRRYPACRFVVTCRTVSYREIPRNLPDFPVVTIAQLDDNKIAAFITSWYAAHVPKPFSREVAEERRAALQQAVQRPELRRLAGNPMLLTDMALLHTHRGSLPNDRAKLYKEVIELLLLRWDEARQGSRLQDLLREAQRDENDLLRTLATVAFDAHSRSRDRSGEEAGDIPHYELLSALQELHPHKNLDWANRVIETIQNRAGLLIAVAEHTFRFPHRSFQEYLAAVHLTGDRDFAAKALALLDETGYWREVIKWAAGRVTHVDDVVEWKGFALLRKLCPNDQPPASLPWHRVWLAGEALLEMSLAKVTQFDEGPELVLRIRGLLRQLLATEAPTPFERMQAGMTLGQLGDERPGVGSRPRPGHKSVPDLAWSGVVQPDEFIMGGKTPYQENLQFKHRLQHPFCVAIYPVTVAQYELFIQDGGYTCEEFWTKTGWQWRTQEERTRPADYAFALQMPNHPRVGVSWYEAVAFCNWLNAAFTTDELKLPDKAWQLRLPTEAEWERAARHTDGRDFPWDPKDQAQPAVRCNCRETELGQTSAVGLFPTGKAVCGAHDMAGNLWEWCLTKWRENYQDYETKADQNREGDSARVLRGGSWFSDAGFARCAFRYWLDPGFRYDLVGFRLVASPFFALNSESSGL